MAKTHYLGFTKAGRPVGRTSRNDYGFRFAAYHPSRGLPSFGPTAHGALTNFRRESSATPEIVEVRVVTGAEYRVAMKTGRPPAGWEMVPGGATPDGA